MPGLGPSSPNKGEVIPEHERVYSFQDHIVAPGTNGNVAKITKEKARGLGVRGRDGGFANKWFYSSQRKKKKRKKKLPGLEELSDVRLVAYVESEK